ncbi:hypothetical protein LDENG_00253380 [Lucifuga dentata]|nr:hypothetical protein LDENG_00253380 [Lucifuga dentata]
MKSPSAASNQWGSYFVDVHRSGGGDEEIQKLTWCCHCIHKYSTMAIPSVEHIAEKPCEYIRQNIQHQNCEYEELFLNKVNILLSP